MKRKRSDDALETKKKRLEEVSVPTSSKRTSTIESSQSSIPMEAPAFTPAPLMAGPSRSLETVWLAPLASLVISSRIAHSLRRPVDADISISA